MLNLARQIIAEGVAFDEEARDAFAAAMEWDDVVEAEQMTQQDRSARHAAQLLGGDQSVDEMVARAWAAKNATAVETGTP